MAREAAEALRSAIEAREVVGPGGAQRLLDGRVEGLPGWTVDRFGPAALVQCFDPDGAEPAIVDSLSAVLLDAGLGGVVLKERSVPEPSRGVGRLVAGVLPAPAPDDPMGDREGRLVIVEHGLRFGVDLLYGFNVGLFLDAAPLRAVVRARSEGRRVLNLFSYTASLGVAAAVGGARSTTNIDLVPSALERGRVNYQLNGLPVDERGNVRSDVFEFLRRARKKRHQWDLVVLDPPPVATQGRKRGYDPERDLRRCITWSLGVVRPGGALLVMTAARRELFAEALAEALDGKSVRTEELARGRDFPGDEGLRAFWVGVGAG